MNADNVVQRVDIDSLVSELMETESGIAIDDRAAVQASESSHDVHGVDITVDHDKLVIHHKDRNGQPINDMVLTPMAGAQLKAMLSECNGLLPEFAWTFDGGPGYHEQEKLAEAIVESNECTCNCKKRQGEKNR